MAAPLKSPECTAKTRGSPTPPSAIPPTAYCLQAKGDRLLEAVHALKQELPSLEVCVHYSLKWNYERSVDASFARLEALARELSLVPGASLLLVSGGGKKKPLDSLKVGMDARLQGCSFPFSPLLCPGPQ